MEARKVKALKAQRMYLRAKIDILMLFADTIPENSILESVQARLISMREALTLFKDVERELIFANLEEPLEVNEVEEKCFEIEAKLGSWIRRKTTESNMNYTLNQTSCGFQHGVRELKLPKSSVPIFSGEYAEWQTFYDLYCANIHDRTSLSPSQKFKFLLGYLRGDASNLVKHLRITDANYNEALQKLRDRYSRKKQIVNVFVGTFLDQPSISIPSASSIRKVLDTSDEILRGVKALGAETEKRDPWIIRNILNKLDGETKSKWMEETRDEDFPTIEKLFEFLQNRVDDLENIRSIECVKRPNQVGKQAIRGHVVSNTESCIICSQDDHILYKCPTFLAWPVTDRRNKVQTEKWCYNCLKSNHRVSRCPSKLRCLTCGMRHNTLLLTAFRKESKPIQSTVVSEDVQQEEKVQQSSIVSGVEISHEYNQAVLPTAIVYLANEDGQVIRTCRALLDCGSQASFICESVVQRCKLNVKHKSIPLAGLNDTSVGKTKGSVRLTLLNSKSNIVASIEAFVLPKVTVPLPQKFFNLKKMKQFANLNLADPTCNVPSQIEMLIGSDQFFNILLDGQIKSEDHTLVAQNTKFGWIISGQQSQQESYSSFVVGVNTLESIERSLRNFWELERVPTRKHLTMEEEICEEIYESTTKRNEKGRFVVRIPFKISPLELGTNTYQAINRLKSVENRFAKDLEFEKQYKQFMAEYGKLGHMRKILPEKIRRDESYFMPHHGVMQQSNNGLKLRVVFDASSKVPLGIL